MGPSHLRDQGGQENPIAISTVHWGSHSCPWASDGLLRLRTSAANSRHLQPLSVAQCQALAGSSFCFCPLGCSARPQSPAAAPADREHGPFPERLPSGGPPRPPNACLVALSGTRVFLALTDSQGALAGVGPGLLSCCRGPGNGACGHASAHAAILATALQ
ncbi:hypothetical protein NDU88_002535 [Pleurodeles waltl]|uniref:Uncharacterized protein n=1 Tax=Pleurodeles waltl TaxID=8319 RepID=A0AAV7KVY8_PLEWA|nr:hypothetical protein NDU88_002535 [Pleurodeles waltl]